MENDDDENSYNSFVNPIFFSTRFNVEQTTDFCSSAALKEVVDNNLFIQLNQEKFNIILDYQQFNSQCHKVNMLLDKHGYFLRAFELKNKFRHLALKNPKTQNIVRELPSCINKKYNGFHVISIEYSKKLREKFKPIDIIYKPVKSPEKKFSVTTLKIYQNHTEILAEMPKIIAWVCL